MPENKIYGFLKENKLTDLDEKSWIDKYSKPENAKQVYSFFKENQLTDLDELSFTDKYLKKKEPLVLGFESATEASRIGGLKKPEKLSQSPLKTAATTTPSVSTKPKWTAEQQKALIEGIKTGNLTGNTPQESDYLNRIGDRIIRGMNTLNYNLAKTPEFVYNLAAMPQNIIAEQFDVPSLAVSAEKVKKDLGIENNVAEYYKEQINQLAALDDKYMGANGSVTELAKQGKYIDAAKLLGEQIAESLPTTAAIAVTGGLGASPTAITLGGGTVFGAAKYDEIADREDLTESEKASISFATGLTEGLFENLGTGNIGRIVKDAISKQGVEQGKQVAKEMFVTAYKDALKKYMPVSGALQGGIEEAATTFAQNAIDIYTGVDPNKKLSDGLIDAFAVGTGSDFIISSPILLSKKRNKQVEEKQAEVDEIDSELSNPNISDDAKATLTQKRIKVMSEINDVIDEDVLEQKSLPESVKREIEQLQGGLEQIDADIENTKSELAKKELQNKRTELENKIEELVTTTEKQTTDEQGRIEEPINRGTDVLEEGIGVAVEPNKEGIAGEDIQTEEILTPQEDAIQEFSTSEVLPREQEEIREAGSEREGVGQGEQRQEITPPSTEEVVSERVSEIEPPVVEQTTADVGGVTSPNVSEITEWDSPEGKKKIEGETSIGDKQFYTISIDGKKSNALIPKSDLHKEIDLDKSNLQFKQESDKAREENEIKKQKEIESTKDLKGFGDELPPMQKAKLVTALNTNSSYKGVIKKRKSAIEEFVAKGYVVSTLKNGKRILQAPDGTFFDALTKAELDYADYLITNNLIEPTKTIEEKVEETPKKEDKGELKTLSIIKGKDGKMNYFVEFPNGKTKVVGQENYDKLLEEYRTSPQPIPPTKEEVTLQEEPTPPKEEGEGDFEARQEKAKEEFKKLAEANKLNFRVAQNIINKYVRPFTDADYASATQKDIDMALANREAGKVREGYEQKKQQEPKEDTIEIINSDNEVEVVIKDKAPKEPTQQEFKETKEAFKKANEVLPDVTNETNSDDVKVRVKSIIDAFINNTDEFDTRTKQELNDRLGRFYDVLSFEKLEEIGNEFIEQLGGIEKAVLIASDGTKDIPPYVRTFVLGQAIINAKKEYKNAKTEAEKNKRLDEQIRYSELLDETSRAYGQANAYIAKFYSLDPIAVVRKAKRKVQERNELIAPTANRKSADIKKIIEDKQDYVDAVNEAVSEALEGTKATIEGLQKEIETLRKEIASKSGKKYKKYPVNLGVTKDQVVAARKRIFGSAYSNPFLNPEFWKDALILAADAIQEGAVKINDFYSYMNTTLKGKYSEAYGELYQRARGLAIEKGAKESDFSTDEEVRDELDRISKESDAKKIARLTALRAKLAAKKEENASKIVANKIISDANRELDNATTQKERDAISKIIQVLGKKAKDATTSKNKPKSQSLSDLLAFVLAEANKGEQIWNDAQKEVFASIDNDNTLSDEKKSELKDFLDNYRKTVFDVLLTKGQKDKLIKEKLIELGYAKQVGGKVVLDLESIIAGTKTTQQAIDAVISKISKETGITEQELAYVKQAFKTRLDDIIVEKKKTKLDSYLKQNERYRAARLINNRTRRTRVEKLIELYNAGGLNNEAVKNALAEELGIVAFTEQDEVWLAKKLQEADDAPTGAEREKIEEEIQAYLETKDAGFLLKEMSERLRARLLSGFLTAIKNLGGFYDTATMLLQQTIFTQIQSLAKQGALDKNVFKIIADARKAALYTAADVFINGGVDMGNAFSEITGTKEGTPRVRYIEYWKPRFDTKSLANPLTLRNKLKEGEKFIGRTMSFFDTINQVLLQETKTYTYLKDMYIRSGYSAKDASQKAYDAMNDISILGATKQAITEFRKRDIKLDMSKKSDAVRFNRRVYEIVQQSREKEATVAGAKFANRYTYKSYDTGIMQPIAVTLSSIKHIFTRAAANIRESSKKYGINYNIADKVATSIEFLGDDIFMVYLPFIKGVANILEKGLELNPYYGLAKSGAYLGVGATANKDFKQEYYQRSGEYLFRAIMGLVVTSLLLSLADDEDEENKKLFGAGQEDFRKQAASKVLRPANTIVIWGRRINLDYLGSYGISLKINAAIADLKRYDDEYSKLDGLDKYQAQIMASLSTILYSGYTQAIYEAIAPKKDKKSTNTELKMKGSELLTRTVIPFTNTSRQLYGMIDPQAKKPISMKDYLAKYSGVVAGWTLDRPNFDYRGRTFNTGQVYSSSPDAFISMFKNTAGLADEVDEFIQKGTKGDFSFTTIRKGDEKYFIMDKETGKMREMTDYEYYDVTLLANKKFNESVTYLYEIGKKNMFDSDYQRESYKALVSDPTLLKKEITRINNLAKKQAFQEMFEYVPQEVRENLNNE